MATRLSWDDHYQGGSYETWGSRRNKLQSHSISKYQDKDYFSVLWSGTEIGQAPTLEKAKALAAKDAKERENRDSVFRRVW